jgi:opacity protein-like surface antigen
MDMKEFTKDLDLALALGFEYDIDENFSLNSRYNLGVTKIFDQDNIESDARNSVFHIGIAYKF